MTAPKSKSYTAGHFELQIDGHKTTTFLKSVDGGWAKANTIDDPVGAISVHGANGLWGVLSVGLFADGTYGAGYNAVWDTAVKGLFYGGGMKQFWAQAIEAIVCIGWNVIIGGLLFKLTGLLVGGNRVTAKVEIAGLDMPEMGGLGYPEYIKHQLPEDISDAEVREIEAGEKLEPTPREPSMV